MKIAVPDLHGISFVPISLITRLQANGNNTRIYLKDGLVTTSGKNLGYYDKALSSLGFVRVHQSHLINTDYAQRFEKGCGGNVMMEDGTFIPVARRKKKNLIESFI